jgi:hypothetical protein
MSLILTPLYTDHFSPNANPLNPADWATYTSHTGPLSALRALTGACEAADILHTVATEKLVAISTPNDSYASASFANVDLTTTAVGAFGVRADTSFASDTDGWFVSITGNGNSTDSTLQIYAQYNDAGNTDIIYTNSAYVPNPSDVWTIAVIGQTGYGLLNGTVVGTHNSAGGRTSGDVIIFLDNIAAVTDVTLSGLVVGSAALPAPPLGPATNGTISVGPFFGENITTAFTNPSSLDIIQVKKEGGGVVWNLDKNGTATTNPVSPTAGALLTFLGASFAIAFGPNPDQLDILQVVQQGGKVVFSVDYQGNAGSH